ncbi:MAG TPA: amidohydrolase family protein [Povalibacter sp.]|uniref:amidohydrolase family protein n=1 Tax=Povalibacter sp. TaxID=1962978 RepID=UPI002CBE57A3|nr:amidohydrolase family protein [Povalibacter sp.]HMN45513.1 amidohydrolase family protein [Povalibacter sp.]
MKPIGVTLIAVTALWLSCSVAHAGKAPDYLFNDSHFHLTNYVQEGTDIHAFMKIMGDAIGRSTLFGIPLQQTWSHGNSGDFAPSYYLQSDAPLYYYSFTDAHIAMAYRSLRPEEQRRLDPMITGFNPADMYAADHIRRVLQTFPGVFSGIGEFSIHKEFVSGKVAGETASLTNPALDRILDFAAEAGLVVILHCDIDMPFAKSNQEPVYLRQAIEVIGRHTQTTIIWAHMGLGRVVHPVQSQGTVEAGAGRVPNQLEIIERLLETPQLRHLYFDISWDEVAKYAVRSSETKQATARLLDRYPDRFLFGTDNVAPPDQAAQLRVFHLWDDIFAQVAPATSLAVRRGNYERLFDAAREKVRAWEKRNAK